MLHLYFFIFVQLSAVNGDLHFLFGRSGKLCLDNNIGPSQLLTEIFAVPSQLARMLEDHRLDHREEAELKQILPVLRERITQAENALKTGEA